MPNESLFSEQYLRLTKIFELFKTKVTHSKSHTSQKSFEAWLKGRSLLPDVAAIM